MIYPDLSIQIPAELGAVHFVGIGGSGMSGIARMMHARGMRVTGSDRSENYNTKALRELGIKVFIGHDAKNIADAQTLVITGALWVENPEYQEALSRGMTVLHRSQALAWLSKNNRVVSIAGAHGKTTSTGMVVTGLLGLEQDPSFVNGGILEGLGVSARGGKDPLFIIEADESDRSFLLYDTSIALITNVDPEHLDFYGSREAFMQAFVEFAAGATEKVVISADDPGALEVLEKLDRTKTLTFGFSEDADLKIVEIDVTGLPQVTIEYQGETYSASLNVYGEYNAVNVVGAVGVLIALGFDAAEALREVSKFKGTKRRFEFHNEINGVKIYDDYAHHPTEVEALLTATKPLVKNGRLIAVHQPHLYSRTQTFSREFSEVLEAGADYTIVLDVDAAREDPVPGVTGALVADKFKDQSKVHFEPDWELAAEHLASYARPGDLVVTMSCGIVYQIIPLLEKALKNSNLATE